MKSLLVMVLSAVSSLSAAMSAEAGHAMTVRPIEIISCDSIPSELPFDVKPMMHTNGFHIYCLVEGEGLIGFKKDSLLVESMKTADGKDISKKHNGSPSCKLGSFPKATDDGKYGVFDLECSENQFGKVEQLAIVGSVVALTGSKRGTKTADLALDAKTPVDIGPFKVSNGSFGGGLKGFGKGDDSDLGVTVAGDIDRIIAITVVDGGKTLKSSSWSSSGDERTYSFTKAAGKSVSVTIDWWEDRAEKKIEFSLGGAKK